MHDGRISIRIEGLPGNESALLDALAHCRKSAWACPSGECLNVESTETRSAEGCVFMTLRPRTGAQLDLKAMEECLRYTLHQAVRY